MTVQVFDTDDEAYLKWMNQNPACFVVNTRRRKDSYYFYLHQSNCHHISTTVGLDKGAYTERKFIKICSDSLQDLKAWFTQNNTKFKGEFTACKTCQPFAEKSYDRPIVLFPDELENETQILQEGTKKRIVVNAYERNPKARESCLNHYGHRCSVCTIDFEGVYGVIGREFIHVHHLKELSEIGADYKVNPISDLRPVCPNCHAMLHQRRPCFSIEDLQRMILKQPLAIAR